MQVTDEQGIPPSGSMRRRVRAVCVLLLISLFALGCAEKKDREGDSPNAPVAGGTLRVLTEKPGSLDPIAVDEVYESAVVRQIYDGLTDLDPDLRLQPGLASSWTISPDERTYTFHLRPNLRFQDGSPLSAVDVAFSIQRCLSTDDEVDCLAQSHLAQIHGVAAFIEGRAPTVEGLQILGDRTLRIDLDSPSPIFLNVLAMDQTVVVPRAVVEGGGPKALEIQPIGSGPFRFVRSDPEEGIVLARNPYYWGAAPLVDTLVYRSIPESRGISEIEALLSGAVDLATLDMGDGPKAREVGLAVYRSPELSVSFLAFRVDRPPFDIPEVRRAALLAIDREALRQIDPEGMAPVAGLLPPGMPGRDPVDRMPARDTVEAARLLVESGHRGGRGLGPVQIATTPSGRSVWMCEQINRNLRAIGLETEIVKMDWRVLDSLAVRGQLQAYLVSWVADLPDATTFLYSLFHSQGEGNQFAYSSTTVDGLLERSRVLPAGPERNEIFAKVQDVILQAPPAVPLYHSAIAYSWRPEVHGLRVGPCGFALIDIARVYLRPTGDPRTGGRRR